MLSGVTDAEIRVTNLKDGEVLRYPVALVQGTATDGESIEVVNRSNNRPDGTNSTLVMAGRFTLLVELVPGQNDLRLKAGNSELEFRADFLPMTTPYRVNVVYVTAEDGVTEYLTPLARDKQDYRAKLATAAKLMQTFTAEAMHEAGYGRRTFNLEFDKEGDVVVHTRKYPERVEVLWTKSGAELFNITAKWVESEFPDARHKNLVVMGYSGYDPVRKRPLAHTARGGGRLALYSNLSMFAWPDSIRDVPRAFLDDTPVDTRRVFPNANRKWYWQLASGTIGACLHEIGHTFGLPHTVDKRCIMSRGYDHINRNFFAAEMRYGRPSPVLLDDATTRITPYFALKMAHSRWLYPDERNFDDLDSLRCWKEFDHDRLVVESAHGLQAVGYHVPRYNAGTETVVRSGQQSIEPAVKRRVYQLSKLRKELQTSGPIRAYIVDKQLNHLWWDEAAAKDPKWFIRRWRLSPAPIPWRVKASVPELGTENMQQLVTSLMREELNQQELSYDQFRRLRWQHFYSVDFNRHFGIKRDAMAYALTSISVDADRDATVLVGADNGVRVWVNGRLAIEHNGGRVSFPDALTADVKLRRGENQLLVEVGQLGGTWGFSLRIVDGESSPIVSVTEGKAVKD